MFGRHNLFILRLEDYMTDIPFYATRMGARFYEHTVPELSRQISRLNDNLERLIEAAEAREKNHDHDDNREEDPQASQP